MWWDIIKDYMNSLIASFLLFVSIMFIPEVRKSKKYRIPIIVLMLLLAWLGIDKLNRDRRKEVANTYTDSVKSKKIDTLSIKVTGLKDTISKHATLINRLVK